MRIRVMFVCAFLFVAAGGSYAWTPQVEVVNGPQATDYLVVTSTPDGSGLSLSEGRGYYSHSPLFPDGVIVRIKDSEGNLITDLNDYDWEIFGEMRPYPFFACEAGTNWVGPVILNLNYLFQNTTSDIGEYVLDGTFALGGRAGGPGDLLFTLYFDCDTCGIPISFLTVLHRSPDLNGDGVVNVIDVIFYNNLSLQGYSPWIDFYWDGVLGLTDVQILAASLGSSCD